MRYRTIVGIVLGGVLCVEIASQTKSADSEPGNEACAGCHAEITRTYSASIMGRASGPASEGLITGEFLHKRSGVRYRVFTRDNRTWMSYARDNEPGFRGERELLYYIGSGEKGRTYLFARQGFLFETPINWYSQEGRWNMAPAYTETEMIPMTLPSLTDCLTCHVSALQPPVPGTENRFAGKPFLHSGITCEGCHGVGDGHIEKGEGRIVNPAKLPAERRDAICMECHFEGDVAIKQPDRHLYEFKPGERLSDYIHYFVLTGSQTEGAQALSQFQALSLSECKRKSGDKMSCLSCHDPHHEPTVQERPAYYRAKCLACHGEPFGAKHHPDKPNCTQCHMPALPSKDVAHTEATDHRIQRVPLNPGIVEPSKIPELRAFPASDAFLTTTRDLALAWETLAERHVPGAVENAERYLRKAVKERPDDPVLLSAFGYVEQQHGHDTDARELYERALTIDPEANEAAANLGVLEAHAGHLQEAVRLWQGAFGRAPYRSEIGMNLAEVFCQTGQTEQAKLYVDQVLEFNPDLGSAKRLRVRLRKTPVKCR